MKKLDLAGENSTYLSDENVEFLGNLMAALLYHKIDTVATMLLQLPSYELDVLEQYADKLSKLCCVLRTD